jgi:competence protein ComEC
VLQSIQTLSCWFHRGLPLALLVGFLVGSSITVGWPVPALLLLALLFRLLGNRCPSVAPLLVVVALATAWAQWQVDQRLQHRLPLNQDQQQRQLSLIVEQHRSTQRSQRMVLTVLPGDNNQTPELQRIRASYYGEHSLQVGDRLEATVKLRAPRNLANGLAFDYETWMLAKGIDAGGYIRRIETLTPGQLPLRERLRQHWSAQLPVDLRPWLNALVFADSAALDAHWWRLGQATGTVHLFVVSGLHLGLVALAGWSLAALLARLLALRQPASVQRKVRALPLMWPRVAVAVSVVGAYLWLASNGIAVWRASLMVVLTAVWALSQRRWQPWLLVCWAAVLLLLANPLAHQQAGFAMSLLVVAALMMLLSGRKASPVQWLWWPQWIAWWALAPLLMAWLQPLSVAHLLANALAVPLVSLLLLPGLLLRALTALIGADGALIWWLDAGLLLLIDGLGVWLHSVKNVSPVSISILPAWGWLLWWGWGWLLWRGLPALQAMVGTLLLLSWWLLPSPVKHELRLLDVGQGLALVASGEQALVYDVGARWSARFNMGEAVVAPSLRQLGVRQLATLVLSHSDNDHAGGFEGLRHWYRPQRIWAGQPEKGMDSCHSQGVSPWHVSGSQLFYRFFAVPAHLRSNDNNHSCVMQLRWHDLTLLLPGDIEHSVEQALVQYYGEQLRSDGLVVGHHGSRSSSSSVWLATVDPDFALISAGWNNPFAHPHSEVLARLAQQGVRVWRTDLQGGLAITPAGEWQSLRQRSLRIWQNR